MTYNENENLFFKFMCCSLWLQAVVNDTPFSVSLQGFILFDQFESKMSASDYKPIPSSELPVEFKDLTVVPLEEVAKSESKM